MTDAEGKYFGLTAQRRRAPVHRDALVAAALRVRRHAGAEALAVAPPAAGARVSQAVHVEPGDVHLRRGGQRALCSVESSNTIKILYTHIYIHL